jgi:hypothetical protein
MYSSAAWRTEHRFDDGHAATADESVPDIERYVVISDSDGQAQHRHDADSFSRSRAEAGGGAATATTTTTTTTTAAFTRPSAKPASGRSSSPSSDGERVDASSSGSRRSSSSSPLSGDKRSRPNHHDHDRDRDGNERRGHTVRRDTTDTDSDSVGRATAGVGKARRLSDITITPRSSVRDDDVSSTTGETPAGEDSDAAPSGVFLTAPVGRRVYRPPKRVVRGECRSVNDFEKLGRVGEGTYGVVYRARDTATKAVVAIKRVKMENETGGMPVSSIREIALLRRARGHSNVVNLIDVAVGRELASVFLIMEFCELLHSVWLWSARVLTARALSVHTQTGHISCD